MKKLVVFAVLALLGVYLSGRIMLGESGAMRFVTTMESHMGAGDAAAVCGMFHADLVVDIQDHTGGATRKVAGGKDQLCDLTREVVDALSKVPNDMRVTFDDLSVKRDWLHPWTSEVSYVENRHLTIRGANVTLSTVSEDTITLVQTFSGVKLRKIVAESFLAE
jgi:hypothetical protein